MNRLSFLALPFGFLTAAAAPPAPAQGQTITVDTLDDVTDFQGAQQVADLPGPDGKVSFREACSAANNTPGPQTIEFAIPQSQWWLFGDRALLRLEDGYFGLTDDETTVDFSSQTAFTGDTNPNGSEVAIYGLQPNAWGVTAIWIFGDRCVVKGLGTVHQRGYGVEIEGNDNRVIGCTTSGPLYSAVRVTGGFGGPTPSGNVIGGTGRGEGNVLEGVQVVGPAAGTWIVGNVITETVRVVSAPDYAMIVSDTRIGGPTGSAGADRGALAGAGH